MNSPTTARLFSSYRTTAGHHICRLPLLLCMILAVGPTAVAAMRQQINLNGEWQFQRVEQLDAPPAAGSWKPFTVPGTLRGYDYERAWFRREFTLPASMRGKRIKLQFDGVKYNSRIYVNGTHVGSCFNGYDAFEVDVTDAVHFDKPNQLAVGCHDWTGVFSEGHVDFSSKPDWQRPRRFVADKVIAPIGGHYDLFGIWADVRLVAHPAVYVQDLFIKPSTRNQELVIDYTIANESDQEVQVELRSLVDDHGKVALRLPAETMAIPAGESLRRTVRSSWPGAHYWSHEDPYLYHLQSQLSTGDQLTTRFGFREFWIEGHRYFLNGSKVNLLASSWWPPTEAMDREEVEQHWRALKAAGVVCLSLIHI
jgi:beta-galactosidase/beta-glucuronidase